MTRVELRVAGRMFIVMVIYHLASTLIAALVGLIIVTLLAPGREIRDVPEVHVSAQLST